ncbi:hypothetical protein [Streptomyces sp. MJM1172]|uniref:hypothetical protein n=1 Tax=Streptomyces sp. MJM1172 TaxID=1703926 RepID=UPI000A95E448
MTGAARTPKTGRGRAGRLRSPARRRLRRLQLRLTLAYTLITLAGVSALSWMVIRTDERSWRAAAYDEMDQRAAVSTSLIYYTDEGLQLDGLYDDEATRGASRVRVLHAAPGGALRLVFTSPGPAHPAVADVPLPHLLTPLVPASPAPLRERPLRHARRDRS